MDAQNLLKGLNILQVEFEDLRWTIDSGSETIVVWDESIEDCSQVSDRAALEALGWYYNEVDRGWSPTSPIY